MKIKYLFSALTVAIVTLSNPQTHASQKANVQEPLPIIDMHVHAFGEEGYDPKAIMAGLTASENPEMLFKETYDQFRKWNAVKAVVSGPLECVETWKS